MGLDGTIVQHPVKPAEVDSDTENAIRHFVQQLKKEWRGGLMKVSIKGLDGTTVQHLIKTGEVGSDPEFEIIPADRARCKVHLDYYSIDQLTHPGCDRGKCAYLPLTITTGYPPDQDPRFKLPLEQVRENFRQKRVKWEASKQCDELRSLLDSADLPPVRKIVAFACSTMRWDEERRRSGSMGQHALILTIRDFLAKRGHVVQCYAQDPIYTDIDRQALDEHGITVLDDPKGFLEIDEETVVISQYPDIPVRQITADITRPALMIWNTVKEKPSFPPTRDDDNHIRMIADNTSPRLDKMVQDYVQLDFPQSPVKRDFGEDTTIYIRKMNL